jgi:TRAP-type C4-dicarboxylate transport system substrate-binding protein
MSQRAWSEMPPEVQQPFLLAAQEAADRANGRDRAMEATALDELKKRGVEVHAPSAEETALWRAAGDRVLAASGVQIDRKIIDAVHELQKGA